MIIKLSKDGIPVIGEDDPANLIFSTEYGTLKYFDKVNVLMSIDGNAGDFAGRNIITHNLNKYIYTEVFVRVSVGALPTNEPFEYVPFFGSGASVAYNANFGIRLNEIRLYGEFNGFSTSTWYFEFLVFMFNNNLNL